MCTLTYSYIDDHILEVSRKTMDTSLLNNSKYHRARMQCDHTLEIRGSLAQNIFWITSLFPFHHKLQNIWAEILHDHMAVRKDSRTLRMDHIHLYKISDKDVSFCNLEEIVYMALCIVCAQRRGSCLLDGKSLDEASKKVSV